MNQLPNILRSCGSSVRLEAAVAVAMVMTGLVGCEGLDLSGVPDMASFQSREALVADWNDVDAAVQHAASVSEMAFVGAGTNDAGQRVCELRTIREETAWIIIERSVEGDPAGESIRLTLQAKVGRFGNAEREALLLSSVRARLRKLHGVATSEIK
ncbi:MAG: hypothetical protein H7210_13255 [Pyrinomonadaceae bacterium]|nr:hypothetical protein [Phycisphaerales bacterium]